MYQPGIHKVLVDTLSARPLSAAVLNGYLLPEATAIDELLKEASALNGDLPRTNELGTNLIDGIHRFRTPFAVEQWLQEYGLDNQEGIVLMQLAEGLLRIPDAQTTLEFVQEKLSQADWRPHIDHSPNQWVNLSTNALRIGSQWITALDLSKEAPSIWQNLTLRVGQPIVVRAIQKAMHLMATQFISGRTIEEALKSTSISDQANAIQYCCSFDMLGEAALSNQDVEYYFSQYHKALLALAAHPSDSHSLSIKLSALHPRYELLKKEALLRLRNRVGELLLLARQKQVPITLDAEESWRLESHLLLFSSLLKLPELKNWGDLGLAVQAYQKRAPAVLDWLQESAKEVKTRIPVRLVKGAYWDTEIKHAQQHALAGYPVFTRKVSTDLSYLVCADKLLGSSRLFPQFATHNAHTVASVVAMANRHRTSEIEFQRLHGMGTALYQELASLDLIECKRLSVRTYCPVGRYDSVLPYLVRRLLENGANSSFVHQILEPDNDENLLRDPQAEIRMLEQIANSDIALPGKLYGESRPNPTNTNLDSLAELEMLLRKCQAHRNTRYRIQEAGSETPGKKCNSPANEEDVLGLFCSPAKAALSAHFQQVNLAFPSWNACSIELRASYAEGTARLLLEHRAEFICLLMRETGKTLSNAQAELHEAMDFCHYYAAQARQLAAEPASLTGPTGEDNTWYLQGRGCMVCISPWNFPLAIFLGQIIAALVSGNTVVARPSSLTRFTAHRAVQLLYQAGFPRQALQLVHHTAADIQWALANQALAGVMFTGSVATAKRIQRTLASREGAIIPLVAETGGQNCLIADSTALPEQLVPDIIRSAFDSAGQRCSALRALFLQDDIYPAVLTQLKGALAEFQIGSPFDLATDLGPLISTEARAEMEHYVQTCQKQGRLLFQSEIPTTLPSGHYFPATLLETDSLSDLEEERFGPILHLIKYEKGAIDRVIQDINQSGYGLTLGIHSRSETFAQRIIDQTQVGNVYVNRDIIGATVGVQPFGGCGLSGTGPKAGGPLYLSRLMQERTVSVNTAAAGGNPDLFQK